MTLLFAPPLIPQTIKNQIWAFDKTGALFVKTAQRAMFNTSKFFVFFFFGRQYIKPEHSIFCVFMNGFFFHEKNQYS